MENDIYNITDEKTINWISKTIVDMVDHLFCNMITIKLSGENKKLFPDCYYGIPNFQKVENIENILKNKSLIDIKNAIIDSDIDILTKKEIIPYINDILYGKQITLLNDNVTILQKSMNDIDDKLNIIMDFLNTTKN